MLTLMIICCLKMYVGKRKGMAYKRNRSKIEKCVQGILIVGTMIISLIAGVVLFKFTDRKKSIKKI